MNQQHLDLSQGAGAAPSAMAYRQDSRRHLLSGEGGFEQLSGHSPQPSYSAGYNDYQNPQYPAQQQPQPRLDPEAQYPPPPQQPSYGYQYNDNPAASNLDPAPASPAVVKRSRVRNFIKGTAEMFQKRWPRYFFLVAIVQCIICIAFESYTFAKISMGLDDMNKSQFTENTEVQAQLKTIPTFLSLFMLGFIYEVVLVWDALLAKNTIQIIGIVIANVALLVYTAIQISDIDKAIKTLLGTGAFLDGDIWSEVNPILIAIPVILAVGTIGFSFVAWKLYQEFAWDILKHIGADYRMKKRFLYYQVYIALLKFDFFFFVGFTIQFLVVVGGKGEVETALTAAAIPVTMGILISAAWFTKKEWKPGMIMITLLYLGGLAYFIFKLARIYDPYHKVFYEPVARSLTAFAVLTIVLIILTITNAMICMFNFGHGLKTHLNTPRQELDKDQVSYSLSDVKQPQIPSRMTID